MVVIVMPLKLFFSHFRNSQIICPKESNSNTFNLPNVWQKLLIHILTYLIFLKTQQSRVGQKHLSTGFKEAHLRAKPEWRMQDWKPGLLAQVTAFLQFLHTPPHQNQRVCARASLVAQWLRICLPVQGTRVQALVWDDPTCRGATRPVSHNY